MKLELETYTPSEAEEVTKVPQATVRNWRRSGHLAKNERHGHYTIVDVLIMVAMQALVSRGLTPGAASGFAVEVARSIFLVMLHSSRAYSEGAKAAAQGQVGAIPQEILDRLRAHEGGAERVSMIEDAALDSILIAEAEQSFGVAGMRTPEWLIIWANGKTQFYYDEDISEETFFGNTFFADDHIQGPVILFCMGAMAHMVLDRLPRPAIRLAQGA